MQLNRNRPLGSITAYAAKQAKALVEARAASMTGPTAGEMAANGAKQLAHSQAAGGTIGALAQNGASQLARAQAAGGQIIIDSPEGRGTEVKVLVPAVR